MQTGAATVKASMEFPQKIKNETAFWPSDSISGNIYVSRNWDSMQNKELYGEKRDFEGQALSY